MRSQEIDEYVSKSQCSDSLIKQGTNKPRKALGRGFHALHRPHSLRILQCLLQSLQEINLGIFFKLDFIFTYVCMCTCMWESLDARQVCRFPGAGGTGSCQPLDMEPGIWTRASTRAADTLNHGAMFPFRAHCFITRGWQHCLWVKVTYSPEGVFGDPSHPWAFLSDSCEENPWLSLPTQSL